MVRLDVESTAEGRLQAANGESYHYDDQGRRIRKTVGGSVTHYLYNGPDIHAEYANWTSASAVYAHGPNWDDPIIRMTGQTNQPSANATYYHQDGLNSAILTTDSVGATQGMQRFDAWGNKATSAGTIPTFGYTGREPDATGLMFYRARYYDPTMGRFISKDPAGMPDGVNRYAYVSNNPTNATDPSGMALETPWDVFNVGVGAVSLANNVRQGNWGWAAVDAIGLGYDSVATAVPFLPAGASAALQAYRAGNSVVNSAQVGLDVAKVAEVANRAAQTTNTAGNAAQTGKAIHSQVSTAIKTGDVSLSKSATQNFWGANGSTGKMPDLTWVNSPGVWADLTTPAAWGKHVSTYGNSFGDGISLLYQRGVGLVDTTQLRSFAGSALTGGQMLFDNNSYFSNMRGIGGSGGQTLSGVSPRN